MSVISSFYLKNEAETRGFAAKLAQNCTAGDVILLYGEVGAGKTTFARGFIQALIGAGEEIVSPTFTLVQVYDVKPPSLRATNPFCGEAIQNMPNKDWIATSASPFVKASGDKTPPRNDENHNPPPIYHCDLYRLKHAAELQDLGLDEAFENAITLIEWPELIENDLPNALKIILTIEGEGRNIKIECTEKFEEKWQKRLKSL